MPNTPSAHVYRIILNFSYSKSLFDYSFVLQGVVWIKVQNAEKVFATQLKDCKDLITNSARFFNETKAQNGSVYNSGLTQYQQLRYEILMNNTTLSSGYWLRGSAHSTIL